MNTNQNVQYQGLLNQNIGTSMNCDDIDCDTINGDYITCIDLTSTGSITANNLGATSISTTNINSDTGEFTGTLLATESATSTISRSNQIATTASTTNTSFPITFATTGSGYKDLLNSTTLSYNPSTQTLFSTGGNNAQGSPYSLWLGQASSTKSAQAVFIDGFSSNQYAQLYCRNNVFGIQGNITSISLEKQVNATLGLTVTGLFTGTNNASSVVSNSNAVYTIGATTGSYYVPLISNTGGTGYRNLYNKSSITYDMTNDIFNCGKAIHNLGDWQTDDPSLVLGTANGNNEGVLEIICSATQSYLIEGTPAGNLELYLKTSGTASLLYQITSTVYNVYADMNLSTGKSYKINNVDLNTDNIQESGAPTNLYFTNARSRSSITPSNTTEINHTYSTSTGILTSNINATSITNAMLAGSIANSKLTNSSITLGSTAMSLGSTITSVAGMTSLTSTLLTASGGSANTNVSLATPSLSLGTVSSNYGVLKLYTETDTSFAVIQKTGLGLSIDTSNTSNSINIGRNTPTYIYIGDATKSTTLYGAVNFSDSRPTYSGGNFLGFSTVRYSTFATTSFSATSTNWYPMREGVSGNNLKLTYAGLTGDIIELKVRLSGAYNSSTGLYMYFDIHKGTQPAAQTASTQVSLVTNTTATSAGWGAHLIGPNVFQGVHFSIVYTFTANESTTFFPVFRTQTTANCVLGSSTVNLNPYAEFSIQRIF